MLEVKVFKRRDSFRVDVSFKCAGGELLAITGPSGAGKTTIIRMLAGLERPENGWMVNEETTWYDSRQKIWVPARDRKIGYVFQEHTLFPHLSVEKNVAFSCRDKSRVHELLEMLGIRHLSKRMPQQISGGERQRTAFAQALASGPRVLLLDEPFSALDITTRKRLRRELKMLKGKLDIPVIFVTHDMEEADYLADVSVKLPCSGEEEGCQADRGLCTPALGICRSLLFRQPMSF